METALKVGDRVLGPQGEARIAYIEGEIKPIALVVHPKYVPGGHNGGDEGIALGLPDGHCRWFAVKDLKPYREPEVLPTDSAARKAIPVATGCLDYFSSAIAEVAKVSKAGNEQHHPGEPLHWERGKSTDHADTLLRHLMERGTLDTDGQRHSAKVAWRALALLQEELEAEGAPKSRGSR